METKVIQLTSGEDPTAAAKEAAESLASGGLVAFPTETVYGIGVNSENTSAVARLLQIKNRPAEKPMSLHIGDLDGMKNWVEWIPPAAHKLMKQFWPGPLTIIFPGKEGGSLGIRYPSHPVAQAIFQQAKLPVLAPSANLSGETPARTAEQVLKVFDGKIDLVIDAGPCELGEASAVIRATGGGYEILREGIITAEMIRKAATRMILLVCTGNICRSPMAEALFKQILSQRLGLEEIDPLENHGYRILSAGTMGIANHPASAPAIQAMKERGIDIFGHRSQPVGEVLLGEADQVYTLAESHRHQLENWKPEFSDKIALIRPDQKDIPDPIGAPVEIYRECAQVIENAIRQRVEEEFGNPKNQDGERVK